jgi:hypothetical protein
MFRITNIRIAKSLCLPLAVAAAVASASAAQAATFTTKEFGTFEMSTERCMQHSKHVLREAGFEVHFFGGRAVTGVRGPFSAQIICASNGVVLGVVAGPDQDRDTSLVEELSGAFNAG